MANGTLKVSNIQTSSGSGTITIGQSGETVTSSATMGSGMGKVLQLVSATDSSERTTTSTSFVTGSNTLSVNVFPLCAANNLEPFELNVIPIKSVKVSSREFKLNSPSLVDDDRSKALSSEYCTTV